VCDLKIRSVDRAERGGGCEHRDNRLKSAKGSFVLT